MDKGEWFFFGIIIGMSFVAIFLLCILQPIRLSQETGNDICYNITSIEGVVASSEAGKLVCEVPSFDSTSNIIVKNNGIN